MNREDIIRMAREAGFNEFTGGLRDDGSRDTYLDCWPEQLERFFHMAQAAEREACAKVCDELAHSPALAALEKYRASFIADAIRFRSEIDSIVQNERSARGNT